MVGHRWLQVVTGGYRWLQVVTGGYECLWWGKDELQVPMVGQWLLGCYYYHTWNNYELHVPMVYFLFFYL